jgi:hypothetical protein
MPGEVEVDPTDRRKHFLPYIVGAFLVLSLLCLGLTGVVVGVSKLWNGLTNR